ncbi:MAG: hypothetical protein DCC55_16015 [Chloroflexi bacterium]|nr:MAG: hypothetical protein DCC55_16015 [Chloroflexota bacterium]
MFVQQPEELYSAFAAALNAGDVAAILDLFEQGGQTVPQPGQAPVIGMPGVRMVMESCVALRPQIAYERSQVIQAGELALLRGRWRLSLAGPDGKAMELSGKSVQVARRQLDSGWRFVIDDPWDDTW